MTPDSGAPSTLALFARFVRRHIGIHFPPERLPELEQKMAPVAAAAGHPDTERYLLRVMSEPLSRERQDLLVGTLTIGETYFLRDPKGYQVLSGHLLPELIAARRESGKSIRIWSAGCSTGEEPYSIAILLTRAIPDLQQWNISLLATDINREALEQARRGVYREWSFRNAPEWLRDYFTLRAGGRHELAPAIRKMVNFREFNLAGQASCEEDVPSGFDIIFCRNVMLYFDEQHIAGTMARFHSALNPGGWLFVSPSEINHTARDGFSVASYDGAFVLRKTDPAAPPQRPRPLPLRKVAAPALTIEPAVAATLPAAGSGKKRAAHFATPGIPGTPAIAEVPEVPVVPEVLGARAAASYAEALASYRSGRYAEAAATALASLREGEDQAEALALSARAYANIGRFNEARACCEKAINCDRLRADYRYLLSIILEQIGDPEGALKALKDALFIDHDYLPAYFALGNLYRQRGQSKEAKRNYRNALRLLERRHPHEVVPEAGDLTAGRLAEMIQDGLRSAG
jgi:chemotaxis protein methyltransferase CheR